MKTAINRTLALLLFAGTVSAQTVPALWDRFAEWTDPSLNPTGSTLGNPAPDSVGNLVWNYEWQSFAIAGPAWAGWDLPTKMVVDPDFFGGVPGWASHQDCCAAVFVDSLLDVYTTPLVAHRIKPFVRWENTTGQSFTLDIVGTMHVDWAGQFEVHPTDVDVGIVFLDASAGNAKTPLYTINVSKPTPASLLGETLVLPPVNVLGVFIDPGDSILISVSASAMPGGNSWVALYDDLRYVVGGGVPAAEIVRLGVPPNPPALLPGVTSGPILGQTWDPVIDHTTFLPASILDVLFVTPTGTNLPLPPLGTLLCDV